MKDNPIYTGIGTVASAGNIAEIILREQQEGLNRFQVIAGNVQHIQDAEVVCLLDTNHFAQNHTFYGAVIEFLADKDTIVLTESSTTDTMRKKFGLTPAMNVVSWENIEAYYLTLLIKDRRRKILNLSIEQTVKEELAQETNANHKVNQNQDSLKRSIAPKSTRLIASYYIIDALFKTYAIHRRNEALLENLTYQRERIGKNGRVCIIAGSGHFDEALLATLQNYSFIVLWPKDLEETDHVHAPYTKDIRREVKERWLAARRAER